MKSIVTKTLLAALLLVPAASAFQNGNGCRGGQGPRNGQGCAKCDKSNCPKGGQCDRTGPKAGAGAGAGAGAAQRGGARR